MTDGSKIGFLIVRNRRVAVPHNILADGPGYHKLKKRVGPARGASPAGKPQPPERVAADPGAGDPPVNIEISDTECPLCFLDMGRRSRKNAPGQPVIAVDSKRDPFPEAFGLQNGENRTEDLFVCQNMLWTDPGKNRGTGIIPSRLPDLFRNLPVQEKRAFLQPPPDIPPGSSPVPAG